MAKSSPKVTLPGSMYQKNKRWWWKVKLPGQTRTKARALKLAGARFAATDRKVAEEVARQMWRLAIEAETEARIKTQAKAKAEQAVAKARAKAADAVAKAKAECEKKNKACKQALAKARAEAQARAQVEAKLNEALGNLVETGTCECCSRKDVPEKDLAKIDSGQLLCPDCLEMLRG